MAVDPAQVSWLKTGALYGASTDAALGARWGTDALETEVISCLALAADAATEAARQQAFLGGPLAIETHNVKGLRSDLIGRPVTITCDRLGYDAGLTVFVIGVEEQQDVERTVLTVLRKLT